VRRLARRSSGQGAAVLRHWIAEANILPCAECRL
jgi:hypothetical protein